MKDENERPITLAAKQHEQREAQTRQHINSYIENASKERQKKLEQMKQQSLQPMEVGEEVLRSSAGIEPKSAVISYYNAKERAKQRAYLERCSAHQKPSDYGRDQ